MQNSKMLCKVNMLYCQDILLFLLFNNTLSKIVKLGAYFPIGWDFKVYLLLAGRESPLLDDGKGVYVPAMSNLIKLIDYT